MRKRLFVEKLKNGMKYALFPVETVKIVPMPPLLWILVQKNLYLIKAR